MNKQLVNSVPTRFVIQCDGEDNMNLFLVDRNKNRSKWWTCDLDDAMIFRKQSAANIQAGKLRFKNPKVIPYAEARKMERSNAVNYSYESQEHPFSSEGLGQW